MQLLYDHQSTFMQKGHAQQLINQVHLHSRQQSIALQWKEKPLYRMINTDISHAALKADYNDIQTNSKVKQYLKLQGLTTIMTQ